MGQYKFLQVRWYPPDYQRMNNIYLKEWGLKGKIKNIEDLNFLLGIEGNNIKKTLKDRKKIEIDYDQIRTKPTIIRTLNNNR